MKRFLNSFFLLVLTVLPALAQRPARIVPEQPPSLPDFERDANPALVGGEPVIQLALLLDTSSSMNGLVRQAKSQLWAMVNAFVKVKKDGVHPKFQVALYEYGSNQLVGHRANVRKIVGLTDNLDEVSEKLMALQATNRSGSEEQCGWAMYQALQELGWSRSTEDLKVICIAGNESFAQGAVDFRIPCAMAGRMGININTIFCGTAVEGERLLWKKGAQLGGGHFSAIDHNFTRQIVAAPQDSELTKWNAALNETFVPYTEEGIVAQQRQQVADAAAQDLAQASLSERASLKASRFYRTDNWDLVEAVQSDGLDLSEVPVNSLPKTMQEMTPEQRIEHLVQLAKQRDEIKKKITVLSEERARYLAKAQNSNAQTLNKAVVDSLKDQAKRKKFLDE